MLVIKVKWCGIDFGQCLMDPSGLRNHLVIGDVCKEMGYPELLRDKLKKYRILREKYGSYSSIKEGHRDEILTYVFNGEQEAMDLFSEKEQYYLKPAAGVQETLEYMQQEGIIVSVAAELKKTLGPVGTDIVTKFLQKKGLVKYFEAVISPQGKINLKDGAIDIRYKGKTKEEGSLWDQLILDLRNKGIEPMEAVIIGDKISTDIQPPKSRGFNTIQYTGYVDNGPSPADYVIASFLELPGIIKRK